ncbi:MAG: FAD-dependent oxidoreductase [Xanthobacteraceae bacterium]
MQSYNFTRSIPVEDEYDLLVAGGGPAGSAAAVCAARLGARVLLVEATGCLGGMSTSGLVNTFGPMGDGERTLVGGFARELIETMHDRGFLGPEVTADYWITHYNRWIPFDPESLKRLLDEYCVEAGVEIRYFTRVVDAEIEGHKVSGAIISNIAGLHQGQGLHRLHRRCSAGRRLRCGMQDRRP